MVKKDGKETTLHILMGLPGCGKTTWGKSYEKKNPHGWMNTSTKRGTYLISMDDIYPYQKIQEGEKTKRFLDMIRSYLPMREHVIADSLIFTNDSIKNLLNGIDESGSYNKGHLASIDNIQIHYWTPDVETCLLNDTGRRTEDSEITIRNAVLELPDPVEIQKHAQEILTASGNKKSIKVTVDMHITRRKEDWKIFFDPLFTDQPYPLYEGDGKIKSGSWSQGGDWADCWGGGGTVHGEPPCQFDTFDKIMERACPTIPYMKYKKIYNSCVMSDSYSESDYYGGSTSHGFWYCYLPSVYNALIEEGIINEVDKNV